MEISSCCGCAVALSVNPLPLSSLPYPPSPSIPTDAEGSLHRLTSHPVFSVPSCSLCAQAARKVEEGVALKQDDKQSDKQSTTSNATEDQSDQSDRNLPEAVSYYVIGGDGQFAPPPTPVMLSGGEEVVLKVATKLGEVDFSLVVSEISQVSNDDPTI